MVYFLGPKKRGVLIFERVLILGEIRYILLDAVDLIGIMPPQHHSVC